MEATGLHDTQIKNWASNRRRKKKEEDVSLEYVNILNSGSKNLDD